MNHIRRKANWLWLMISIIINCKLAKSLQKIYISHLTILLVANLIGPSFHLPYGLMLLGFVWPQEKTPHLDQKLHRFLVFPSNDISHVHEKLTTAPFGLGTFSFANDFNVECRSCFVMGRSNIYFVGWGFLFFKFFIPQVS